MNSVRVLSLAIGRNYTYETRLELKRLGPPRPNLNIVQVQNACKSKSSYARKFNASMYDLADWLCGCDSKNAFFCYTCLVMNVYDPGWTTIGVADIKHIREKVKKHKSSGKHIQGAIDYEMLGKVDIRCQLDSAYRLQIKQFNEEVSKNRYILGKLIDCIKVCGKFELASQEHNEKETSDNPGIFRGLINLMGELDSRLKEHIEKTNSQVFMGLSKTIQNDLLDSIYAVCIKLIRQEISKADFIAIEVDETTDCATLSQLVFIVRYVLGGEIFERFITFIVPKSRDAQGVTSAILGELEKLEINKSPNKLIAQSYDGSSVMSGQDTGVQALVRAVYNNAQFIHCYAHQLYLVIERCATQSKQVKTFFSSLEGFSSFFTKSTKRTAVLDHVLRKRITQNTATIWSCKEICVNIVHTYKKEINECLEIIADDPTSDYSTCRKATGLKNFLKDHDFLFWLRFFNIVLPHSGILFNAQQQQREIDSVKTRKNIKNFKTTIKKIRKSLDVGQEWLVESNAAQDPLRFDFENREVAKEVCDVILTCIEERFKFSDHLSVALLLQPSLFHKHRILFPENELKMAVKLFSLNPMELKQELTVIYNRTDFSNASGALPLLRYIYENNLEGLLPESVKLLRIICTIPMTTAESERRFSTLKRIKTFTRNTMKEDKLNALAMCSIEKDLLSTQNFNELVINQFAEQKERRMDFIYKQINYNCEC